MNKLKKTLGIVLLLPFAATMILSIAAIVYILITQPLIRWTVLGIAGLCICTATGIRILYTTDSKKGNQP